MLTATIRNMVAHKLRLFLTTMSITLGVALLAGTMILTNTMGIAFDMLFGKISAGTDAVILQRVVCCYPNATTLVIAAADHARRVLVLTFPVDRWWLRRAEFLLNLWPRVRGWKFRAYVHPTSAVLAAASARGMRLAERRV